MLGTHPLVRFLNQNRRQIRITILAIVMFLLAIRLLNSLVEKQQENQINEVNTYYTQVSNLNEKKKVIEDFLKLCIKKDESSAYALLSSECKENLFPTLSDFKVEYVQKYFSSTKTYKIEQLGNSKENVFLIKVFDDVLSTGKVNANSNVVTQQFEIVQDGNDFKIKEII